MSVPTAWCTYVISSWCVFPSWPVLKLGTPIQRREEYKSALDPIFPQGWEGGSNKFLTQANEPVSEICTHACSHNHQQPRALERSQICKEVNVRKLKHKDAPTTLFVFITGCVSQTLHLMWIDSMISKLTEHVSHIIPGYLKKEIACKLKMQYHSRSTIKRSEYADQNCTS